jgi:hypothetical protein
MPTTSCFAPSVLSSELVSGLPQLPPSESLWALHRDLRAWKLLIQ